jgi:hypothetical protein
LTADITALLEGLNVAGSSSLVVPGEYLEVDQEVTLQGPAPAGPS